MATVVILTPEDLQVRDQKSSGTGRSGRRRSPERLRLIEEFKGILADVVPGYGADVALDPNEDKRIVRQNLASAAEDLGIALDFRPIKDKTRIHFRVITIEEKAARPRRGGGRPRKYPRPDGSMDGATSSAATDGAGEQTSTTQKRATRTAK
jgi:hypothetical protein